MGAFFTAAGPMVWIVLALAVVAIAASIRYLTTARPALVPLALGTAAGSLCAALLGAVAGFQRAVGPLGSVAPDRRWVYLLGVSESLGGVLLALAACLVVALALGVGGYRARRATSPEATPRGAVAEARA